MRSGAARRLEAVTRRRRAPRRASSARRPGRRAPRSGPRCGARSPPPAASQTARAREGERAEAVQDPAGQPDRARRLVVEMDHEVVARGVGVAVRLVVRDRLDDLGERGRSRRTSAGSRWSAGCSPRLSGASMPRKNSVTHCSFDELAGGRSASRCGSRAPSRCPAGAARRASRSRRASSRPRSAGAAPCPG